MASALQALRKEAGYKTAKEFAAELDIPIATYGRYESNPRKIPLSSAWIIADKLDCSIDCVVGRSKPDSKAKGESIQALYDSLSNENRELMDDFVSFIKLREQARRRRKQADQRRRYDNLAEHYQRLFLHELADTRSFDQFIGYDTPKQEREAFRSYIEEIAAAKRTEYIKRIDIESKEAAEGGTQSGEPQRLRAQLEKRDKDAIDGIMEAYDRRFSNVTHAFATLETPMWPAQTD